MEYYTDEELHTLLAFDNAHPDPDKVLCCFYCHKQKPVAEISQVLIDIDTETGIAIQDIDVCHDCLLLSTPDQNDYTDGEWFWLGHPTFLNKITR